MLSVSWRHVWTPPPLDREGGPYEWPCRWALVILRVLILSPSFFCADSTQKNFSVCSLSPLTFQPVERVPFFPKTLPREERPWNNH